MAFCDPPHLPPPVTRAEMRAEILAARALLQQSAANLALLLTLARQALAPDLWHNLTLVMEIPSELGYGMFVALLREALQQSATIAFGRRREMAIAALKLLADGTTATGVVETAGLEAYLDTLVAEERLDAAVVTIADQAQLVYPGRFRVEGAALYYRVPGHPSVVRYTVDEAGVVDASNATHQPLPPTVPPRASLRRGDLQLAGAVSLHQPEGATARPLAALLDSIIQSRFTRLGWRPTTAN